MNDVTPNPYHILVAATPASTRTRVLKHGDTFAVFDPFGDVEAGGLGEEGLYHGGTRFLSRFSLLLEGMRPFFLSSTARGENEQLRVHLTNPDLLREGRVWLPLGTLHVDVRKFLWQGACHQEIRVTNLSADPVSASLVLQFACDFADIYEVRGMRRKARGRDLPPELGERQVALRYLGLDEVERCSRLRFDPVPGALDAEHARFDLALAARAEVVVTVAVACERGGEVRDPPTFASADAAARRSRSPVGAPACRLHTSNGPVDAWIRRAEADVGMMTTELATGPYPYAGVPWFNTPFGRDGLVTALQCLWLEPSLARGVLAYLAATQARSVVPEQDAEPGKILHETRSGEMATLKEMPFGRYYGSVDATPLFVVLAGAYYERTGDRAFIEGLWPHVEAALAWIDLLGDVDGDGFVEYDRRAADGLLHQGWKDSDDAVFHSDGALATGPIALCEVQAYVFAARTAGAKLAALLGLVDRATQLTHAAIDLREQFERAFWCEDLSTFALALDGEKRPCRVRTSNAGHCLYAGIARPTLAQRVARTLMAEESFSGWGVRTVATTERRYNPIGYHTGAVWPHDNALIAAGFARYGFADGALRLLVGQLEAGLAFESHRMPELFCGFARSHLDGPVPHPVACAPQAWSAGAVPLLLQACLGVEIDGPGARVRFTRPLLPRMMPDLRILDLPVGEGSVDLLLVRHEGDVGVNVLRRKGPVRVEVVK